MSLSKNHIQRIDTFLERFGFDYIDVRFEMVDHIATEIEDHITDYNAFFKKDRLEGAFLRYMMSKKKDLEARYYSQIKKQFWYDLLFILKAMFQKLLNVKVFLLILSLFFLLQLSINYSINIFIFVTLGFIISFSYAGFSFNKEVKKCGKIRILHSFITLCTVPSYIAIHSSNLLNIIIIQKTPDNPIPFLYGFLFIIVFNILLTYIFMDNRNKFRKKYKHILN